MQVSKKKAGLRRVLLRQPPMPVVAETVQEQSGSLVQWLLVILALLLIVGEGAVRKWVGAFASGAPRNLAYFSKDIVFGLLLLLPFRGAKSAALVQFGHWLTVGTFLFLIGAALSCLFEVNIVGAFLTLRSAVALPVIAFFAIGRLRGLSVRLVAWFLASLTLLNFVLALVQNQLPYDHVLNQYAMKEEAVVTFGLGVRATGTFSYITGLGVMCTVGVWAGLALLSLSRRTMDQIAGYVALGAGFGCGLAAVSRGPVVTGVVMVLVWLVFSGIGRSVLGRRLLGAVLVSALVVGTGLSGTFSRLAQNIVDRHESADDTFQERGFGQFGEMTMAIGAAPFGRGLGTEQVGGNFARSGEMSFTNYESQLPRLVMESGILGLGGFLVVSAGALLALERARRDAATREESSLLLATQLLLLPILYGNIIYNHVASAFVWMIFAVVLSSVHVGPSKALVLRRRGRYETRRGVGAKSMMLPVTSVVENNK
jgi:hypothetical protein